MIMGAVQSHNDEAVRASFGKVACGIFIFAKLVRLMRQVILTFCLILNEILGAHSGTPYGCLSCYNYGVIMLVGEPINVKVVSKE